jgi:RNA polymerase sigma-70 factor (ECF subfamily)
LSLPRKGEDGTGSDMHGYSDSEILELFKSGDNPNYAFNLLVKKYRERVYLHIRRMVVDHDDADDVVQNTFIKAWKGLGNFREDAKVFTWLYRIATNESLNFLKKKKARAILSLGSLKNELTDRYDSSPHISEDRIVQKLQRAILKLPDRQRLVFNMRYYDEMKYEEIAEITGVTVGALKASYHIAAKKIEEYMLHHI